MKESQIKARLIELIQDEQVSTDAKDTKDVKDAKDAKDTKSTGPNGGAETPATTPAAGTAAANTTDAVSSAETAPATPTTPAPSDATGANSSKTASDGEDSQSGEPLILINVTNPKNNESDPSAPTIDIVYKSTYSICGVRDDEADPEEPIVLILTRYNEAAESYTEIADIDGETRWVVGSNGVFTRSVLLEEGENRFAIAACKASVIKAASTDGKVISADEVQVEKFTITYRSQNVAEKISEVFKELTIANILKEIDNS